MQNKKALLYAVLLAGTN